MSKSAILKSSIAKKWLMALTGLFLCLFLVGHLAGNLQFFIPGEEGKLMFNEYAVFMGHNPLIQAIAWFTKVMLLFHAIDGIMLVMQNRAARPKGYAYNKPSANSKLPSRVMGILGIILLAFIVVHLSQFWAPVHYGDDFPIHGSIDTGFYTMDGVFHEGAKVKDMHVFVDNVDMGAGMKDLHQVTLDCFSAEANGVLALVFVIVYVISMIAVALHLKHGFASAFQSLGINHKRYNGLIKLTGLGFATLIPLLFAAIPVYLYVIQTIQS